MLMAVTILHGETPTPKRRVDLGHNGFPRWKIPPIEGPEVNATDSFQIDISKPRNDGAALLKDETAQGRGMVNVARVGFRTASKRSGRGSILPGAQFARVAVLRMEEAASRERDGEVCRGESSSNQRAEGHDSSPQSGH